jgi:Flp pilus assembly protein TadD
LSQPINAVLLEAAELLAAGEPRKAIRLLRPVVAAQPHDGEAWCRLAAAYLDAGEAAAALDAATRARALGADAGWAHRVAALALSELARHGEAAVAARAAVRAKPTDWRCHVTLAEVLAADPAAPEPVTKAPGSPRGGATEGGVLAGDDLASGGISDAGAAEPGRGSAAKDAARRAVELAPSQPRPYEVLGDIALRSRDWGTAEWAYRSALRLDPDTDHARRNLALVDQHRSRSRSERAGAAAGRGNAPGSGTGTSPTPSRAAEAVVWRMVARLAAVLAAGAVLLMLAGQPTPTRWLAWGGAALLAVMGGVVVRVAGTVPRGGVRPLARLVRRRLLLGVATVLLGLGVLLLAGWMVAVFFGASTVQPLVSSGLCAVLALVITVPGGAVLRRRRARARRANR